jgi:sulfoxide reductase heme-binding subunit YedZ
LMVSPLARFLRQPAIKQARRPLGLYTFLFVTLHLMVLVGYDYRFDLPLLFESYSGKPFIWLGLSSGLILAGLALTSFAWWKRRLYKWWQRIHRLLYLAAILDLAHYFLGIKGNILTLSGNIARPSAYAIVMIVLLLLRLPMWIHTTGIRHNGSSTDLE